MGSRPTPFYIYEESNHVGNHHPGDTSYLRAQRGAAMKVSGLGAIPDLRFEYSYLRSIQPYFKLHRSKVGGQSTPARSTAEGDEGYDMVGHVDENKETAVAVALPSSESETIDIEWREVLWVSTRDQIISPFLQGALWAIASCYLSPFSSEVGAKMGSFVRSKLPSREGTGVSFLRKYAGAFGILNNKLA